MNKLRQKINFTAWYSRFFRPNSVLRRTFLLILCILLSLTFVFQLLLYHTMYLNMKERIRTSSTSVTELAVALSDAKFDALSSAAEELAWNPTLLEASVFPGRVTPSRNFEIVRTLKSFVSATEFVSGAAFLTERNGMVFTSQGVTASQEEAAAAPDFSAPVVGQLGDSCALVRTADGRLCLRYSFVAGSGGYLGQLLLYLESGPLFSYICGGNHNLCIYSAAGDLLYSGSDALPYTPEITAAHGTAQDTKEVGAINQISEATQLHFCLLYPRATLHLGEFLSNNANLPLLILFFLPLAFLLAMLCAWRFCRPLQALMDSLPETEGTGDQTDDWATLGATISSLSSKTDQFHQILGTVAPYIQKEVLQELLNGQEVLHLEEMLSGIHGTLPLNGRFLLFCTFDVATGVLNAAAISHTIHRLENLSAAGCQFFSFEYRYQLLTLVSLPDEDTRSLEARREELLHTVMVYTRNLPNRRVRCSQLFHTLPEIQEAYQQITTQHHSADTPRSVAEMQAHIRRSVRSAADQSEEAGVISVNCLLNAIQHAEFSPQDIRLCCETLLTALEELAREYGLKPSWDEQLVRTTAPDALPEVLRSCAAAQLHEIFIKLDNRQRKYFIEAKTYMENHYMEYDLSLNAIAEKIGISASLNIIVQ